VINGVHIYAIKFNFKAKLGGQLSNVLDMEYAKKDLIKINTSVCYAMRSEKGFV